MNQKINALNIDETLKQQLMHLFLNSDVSDNDNPPLSDDELQIDEIASHSSSEEEPQTSSSSPEPDQIIKFNYQCPTTHTINVITKEQELLLDVIDKIYDP